MQRKSPIFAHDEIIGFLCSAWQKQEGIHLTNYEKEQQIDFHVDSRGLRIVRWPLGLQKRQTNHCYG
jgi:hypothetical protein